jgi:hypothetical protein
MHARMHTHRPAVLPQGAVGASAARAAATAESTSAALAASTSHSFSSVEGSNTAKAPPVPRRHAPSMNSPRGICANREVSAAP